MRGGAAPRKLGPALDRWASRAAALVLTLVLVLGLVSAGDYGATTDEPLRMLSSWRWWHALSTGEFSGIPEGVRANYGVLFDLLGQAVWTLHRNVFGGTDEFAARHLLCFFAGWLGLLGTYRLAARLAPQPVPLVALVLLVLAPRWYGSSVATPKAIPCAAAWVGGVGALVRASASPGAGSTIRVAVLAALCAAVRPFGALLFPLALVTLALTAPGAGAARVRWFARHAFGLCGLGLGLVFLLWPELWLHSPWHLVSAIGALARNIDGSRSLFFGAVYPHDAAPAAYAAVWLAITLPGLHLVGLALGAIGGPLALMRARAPLRTGWPWALVGLWIAAPTIAPAIVRVGLYDTVRQLLFVVPALCLVAAVGLVGLARRLAARRALALAAGLVALVSAGEVVWRMIRLHPYEQLYFGPVVGGLAGAQGRFDVAHYSETYREGLAWLRDHAGPGARVHVLGNGAHTASFYCWKYGLTLNTPGFGYYVSEVRQGWEDYLPGAVLHTIEREGVPLLVVKRLEPMEAASAAQIRGRAGEWRAAVLADTVFLVEEGDQELALPLARERAGPATLYLRYRGGMRVWREGQVILDLPRVTGHMVASIEFPGLVRLDLDLPAGTTWLRLDLTRVAYRHELGVYYPAASALRTPADAPPPSRAR